VGDEKFEKYTERRGSNDTSSSTLLEEDIDTRLTPRRKFTIRWMMLAHAALLSLSFTLFMSAFLTRASTLTFVKKYSAYCKFPTQQC
jgi:hypothetical protein